MDNDSGDDEGEEDWLRQATVVEQEVCPKDEVMHVENTGLIALCAKTYEMTDKQTDTHTHTHTRTHTHIYTQNARRKYL